MYPLIPALQVLQEILNNSFENSDEPPPLQQVDTREAMQQVLTFVNK